MCSMRAWKPEALMARIVYRHSVYDKDYASRLAQLCARVVESFDPGYALDLREHLDIAERFSVEMRAYYAKLAWILLSEPVRRDK